MLSALLAAASLLALGADDPTAGVAEGPLAGCAATPIGEEGWSYECRRLYASVLDDERRLDAEFYLSGAKTAATATEPGVTSGRERARLGGRDAELLRSVASDGVVEVTALLALPEGSRVLRCAGSPSERCRPLLDLLAAGPWRGGPAAGAVVRERATLRIGDRKPDVPEGCRELTAPTGGQIICTGGFLAFWAEMPDEESLSRALREFREKVVTMAPWPGEPEALPCRIAGVAASCLRLAAKGESGRFVAMWGGATLGAAQTLAGCTARGDAPIPPPCSSVFEAR